MYIPVRSKLRYTSTVPPLIIFKTHMSIERDLQEERIGHLDLSGYVRVNTGTSIGVVLNAMRRHRVSAVLVENDEGTLAGIFTERDVLNKVVDGPTRKRRSAAALCLCP